MQRQMQLNISSQLLHNRRTTAAVYLSLSDEEFYCVTGGAIPVDPLCFDMKEGELRDSPRDDSRHLSSHGTSSLRLHTPDFTVGEDPCMSPTMTLSSTQIKHASCQLQPTSPSEHLFPASASSNNHVDVDPQYPVETHTQNVTNLYSSDSRLHAHQYDS